jgi:hypothetical protein
LSEKNSEAAADSREILGHATRVCQKSFNFNVLPAALDDLWRGNGVRRWRKPFAVWNFDFANGENVFPSGRLVSPTAKTFFRLEDWFRRQRKRFSVWKIGFADGENVFPSGRLISPTAKTFFRLED